MTTKYKRISLYIPQEDYKRLQERVGVNKVSRWFRKVVKELLGEK